MIEPKRFLDAKGAPDEITHLLRVARRDAPPRGLRSSTWQALVAKSAAAGVVVGAASAATSKGTAMAAGVASAKSAAVGAHAIVSKGMLLLALKSAVVCGGVGVCAIATHRVLTEQRRSEAQGSASARDAVKSGTVPRASFRSRADQNATNDRGPDGVDVDVPHVAEGALPSVAPESTRSASAKTTPVLLSRAPTPLQAASVRTNPGATGSDEWARFEAQRVAEIRKMLRGGDGAGALHALAVFERQAKTQLLAQEREALKIDAHLLLGHENEAHRLVQRFRERYPNSPLSARWSRL